MATKFSMKRLLSFPFADMNISTSSPIIFSLSNLAQNAHKLLKLHSSKVKNHSDEGFMPLQDWQARFQSLPVSNIDATSKRVDFFRSFHHAAHCLENRDVNESAGAASKIAFAIVPKEKPEIISHFLISNYHKQEPISVALGMPLDEIEGWFQRFVRRSMFASVCDVSVQAIDENISKRVGVLCSIIIDPRFTRPMLNDYTDPVRHPVNAEMNEFYDSLESGLNPAEAAGLECETKCLEHMYLSVHPSYANQGIGNRMVELSESLASNVINCRVGYVIATSEYSYLSFLKQGYKVVRELKYADYTNNKGEKIFAGKEEQMKPHHACRAMVKVFQDLY